jgi:hypothetical protein
MEIRYLIMSRRLSLRLVELFFILCSLQMSKSFAILPAANLKARQNLLSSPPCRMRKASFVVSAKAEKKIILTEVPLDRQPVEGAEDFNDEIIAEEMDELSKSQSEEPKLKLLSEPDHETVEKIPGDLGDIKEVSNSDETVKVDGPTERKTVTTSGSSKPKKQKTKEIKEVNQKEALKSDESAHLSSRNTLFDIDSEKVEEVEDLAGYVLEVSVVNDNSIEEGSVAELQEVNSADVLTSECSTEDGIRNITTENDIGTILKSVVAEVEVENESDKLADDRIQNTENQNQVNEDIAKIKMFVGTAEFWDPFTSDFYPEEESSMKDVKMDQDYFLESELFDIEKKKEKKKNVLKYVETFSFEENIEDENEISKSGKNKSKSKVNDGHGNGDDSKIISDNALPENQDPVPMAPNIDMMNILLELEERITSLQDLLSDEKSRSLQLVEAFLKIEIEHETLRAEFLQYKIMALELTAGKDP